MSRTIGPGLPQPDPPVPRAVHLHLTRREAEMMVTLLDEKTRRQLPAILSALDIKVLEQIAAALVRALQSTQAAPDAATVDETPQT